MPSNTPRPSWRVCVRTCTRASSQGTSAPSSQMRSVFSMDPHVARSRNGRQTATASAAAEVALVDGADRRARARVLGTQARDRLGIRAAVAEPPGKREQRRRIRVERLDRLIALEPKPIFERAEKVVAGAEHARVLGGQKPFGGERSERGPGPRHAQGRVRVAVAELQRLDEELDVDEAAAASL